MNLPSYTKVNRAYSHKAIHAWALYDFANSSFPTIIGTFIYATYFTKAIAEDEVLGLTQWSWAVTFTGLVVAFLSPFVGALADQGRLRKRFLAVCIVCASAGAGALFFPTEGQVLFALSAFAFGHIAYETGNVFYNAYLPGLVPSNRIGSVSGLGQFYGYIGGIVCLVVALYGLVQADSPLFGFSTAEGENIRATSLLVTGWFVLFSVPILSFVRSQSDDRGPPRRQLFRGATAQLRTTLTEIRRRHKQVLRFLIARLLYNDGLVTIFAFGGIYAAGTFGFEVADVIIFGIALNLAAGVGALAFGFLDDSVGGKTTICVTLIGLCCFTALGVLAPNATWFWVAGLGAGLMVGPNQAASRSLMGRFAPVKHENEFFGFYALSGKATAFMGPLLMGQATLLLGSQRAGMATILLFFVAGLVLLLRVDEQAGMTEAGPDEP